MFLRKITKILNQNFQTFFLFQDHLSIKISETITVVSPSSRRSSLINRIAQIHPAPTLFDTQNGRHIILRESELPSTSEKWCSDYVRLPYSKNNVIRSTGNDKYLHKWDRIKALLSSEIESISDFIAVIQGGLFKN